MHGSPALFAVSVVLLLLTSWMVMRWVGRRPGDSLWALVAAAASQLGGIGGLASLFRGYAPAPYLVIQAGLAAVVFAGFWRWRRGRKEALHAELASWAAGARALAGRIATDPLAGAMVLAILAFLGCSAAEQLLTPVYGIDERAYNCSRVLYWMQFHSLLPFESHNDGQMDMPFGAELWFGWGVMFTRDEALGRAALWLGFPVAVAGAALVVRQVGGGLRAALTGALLVAATPTVLFHAGLTQKQDLWTAAYSLGVAYWTAAGARRGRWAALFWAAFYLALAMNARMTCIAMAPVVGLAAPVGGPVRTLAARIGGLAAGGIAGAVLSGLAITVGHNLATYHHPFGSPAMGKVVQPDFTVNQAWTHTVRAVLFLIELPEQPVEAVRAWMADAGNAIIPAVGAAPILPGEEHPLWPGKFKFEAKPTGNKYSLGGMLWMAGLVGGGVLAMRRVVRTWPRPRIPGVVWVMGLSAAALLEQIYLLRWAGGTWPRYWIGCYAVGAAAAVALAARWVRFRPWPGALAMLAMVWMVYPSLRTMIGRVESAAQNARPVAAIDEPYDAVTPLLEPGSRTLLLCVRATRDYGLFLPRQHYAAEVYPWGKRQPDTDRLDRMIREHGITHVLFERDDALGFHWDPVVRTSGMVKWMQQRPEFHEVLLPDPRMRLFERVGAGDPSRAVPAFYGFDRADGLGDLEQPRGGGEAQPVRWGIGKATTLTFQSRGGRGRLLMECRRNNLPDQAITIKVNGREVGTHEFREPLQFSTIEADFVAAPGENTITIEYLRQETDRNLAVLYRKVQVLAVRPR